MGVVVAQDAHTIEAVAQVAQEGLVEPVLYGLRELIRPIWDAASGGRALPEVIAADDEDACVAAAISDARRGQLELVMKGKLETGALMKAVVNRETGIRVSDHMSLIAMMESPYYHKVFAITDVGLMTYPELEQKKDILLNAVAVFHRLGVPEPKVGVLAAVEKANAKMPDSMDAASLKNLYRQGELSGCVVEGPISYDLCVDKEAAQIKEFHSPVAGDADILLVPNIVAGNLLAKSLTCTGGAKTCGVVSGAQIPVIVTSRAATAEDKYMSIVLAAVLSQGPREENAK